MEGHWPDRQFEGWESGELSRDMVKAMLSGCIVVSVVPGVQHGRSEYPFSCFLSEEDCSGMILESC